VITGRIVVEEGMLAGVDPGPLVERHNKISRACSNAPGWPEAHEEFFESIDDTTEAMCAG